MSSNDLPGDEHSHSHDHDRESPPIVDAALAQRVDPTGTTVLRERRFKPQLTKRYTGVRGAVRTTIQENDALGLSSRTGWQRSAALARGDISPRQRFHGADDLDREQAFLRWFENALRDGVLEPASESQIRRGQHYSAEYIEEAYRKGIRDGASQVRSAGEEAPEQGSAGVYAAVSGVTLAMLYQRTYSAIEGTITTAARDVTRVFDELYPRSGRTTLSKEVNRAIADGGESDAVDVARTEPIYAYVEGQLDQFEDLGVEQLDLEPEANLSTAGDSKVCSECRKVARQGPYKLDRIRRNPLKLHPPLHPNCRCRLVFSI